MAPRYRSDHVELLLTLTVLLIIVISTESTKQCTPKKTEGGVYVIRNIGIKLCKLKCAEHGQCASIEYDIETLTCRLLRDGSMIEEKEGHVILARSHSHVPNVSCTFGMCTFGQRCLMTRSGKGVCVQVSTALTDPPVTVTTQDLQATPLQAKRDLLSASEDGDLERVKQILAAGHVDINCRGDYRRTALMEAAWEGYSDVVDFLMGKGADVSLVSEKDTNVLHYASQSGDLETVKLILSCNGLDINARTEDGKTAADMARDRGHQLVLDLLLSRGAH